MKNIGKDNLYLLLNYNYSVITSRQVLYRMDLNYFNKYIFCRLNLVHKN